jgi:hypothetical protein
MQVPWLELMNKEPRDQVPFKRTRLSIQRIPYLPARLQSYAPVPGEGTI